MAIPYVKQTWTDGSGGATPVSAARLGVLEQGVYDSQRMPAARVYHSANQTAPTSGTQLTLAFDSERFDTDTIHDTVTNNSRLTCRTAGVYQITGHISWAANATGARQLSIKLNGTTFLAIALDPVASAASLLIQGVTTLYQLAVNDYVELQALQTSGGALVVNASPNYSPEFMMARVST